MREEANRAAGGVDLETTLRIPGSNQDEFLQGATPVVRQGNIEFYQSLSDPRLILWIERWPSREALQERLETQAYRALMGAAKTLGRILDVRLVDDSRTAVREAQLFRSEELGTLIQGSHTEEGGNR